MISPTERHYSVTEVAEAWNLDEDSVRDIFRNELGVLRFGRPATNKKRAYTTLRIPQSVLDRVYRRMLNGA